MIKKIFFSSLFFLFIKANLSAHDLSFKHEHGVWTQKKAGNNGCSILQIPLTEKGKYTSRGPVIFYVFKEGNAEYVRIDAGYPYDSEKYVKVNIDNSNYQFFGEDDSAWSMKDDSIIINAMKAGKSMKVVGYSQRGTETIDTYSLIGFTKAYDSLKQDC